MAYKPQEIIKAKETIIDRIANGNSLKSILDNDKSLPSRPIVYEWLNEENDKFDKEFLNNYTRATEERADFIFDEMLEIADNTEEGVTIKETDKGIETTTGDMIHHRRLKVDSRKWVLGRMNPKKYGDRQKIELETKPQQPLFPNV